MKQLTINLVQWNTKATKVVSHLEEDKNLTKIFRGKGGSVASPAGQAAYNNYVPKPQMVIHVCQPAVHLRPPKRLVSRQRASHCFLLPSLHLRNSPRQEANTSLGQSNFLLANKRPEGGLDRGQPPPTLPRDAQNLPRIHSYTHVGTTDVYKSSVCVCVCVCMYVRVGIIYWLSIDWLKGCRN
jgi:hypothetical protein